MYPSIATSHQCCFNTKLAARSHTSAYGFSSSMEKSLEGVAVANLAAADSFPTLPVGGLSLFSFLAMTTGTHTPFVAVYSYISLISIAASHDFV